MGNLTPCKIVPPKNIIFKHCIHDYIGEVTRHANFGFSRHSGGFSPNRQNITTLWLFWLSCPVFTFFLDPAPRSNRWTDFYALWLKRRVSTQGWSFWELERWVPIFGEVCPQNGVLYVSWTMGLTRCYTRNSSGDEIANVNFLYDDIVHVLQNTIDSCINSSISTRRLCVRMYFYQIQWNKAM